MFNKARMAISKSIELYNQIVRAYKFHPYANIVAGAVDTHVHRDTRVFDRKKKKRERERKEKRKEKTPQNMMKTLQN